MIVPSKEKPAIEFPSSSPESSPEASTFRKLKFKSYEKLSLPEQPQSPKESALSAAGEEDSTPIRPPTCEQMMTPVVLTSEKLVLAMEEHLETTPAQYLPSPAGEEESTTIYPFEMTTPLELSSVRKKATTRTSASQSDHAQLQISPWTPSAASSFIFSSASGPSRKTTCFSWKQQQQQQRYYSPQRTSPLPEDDDINSPAPLGPGKPASWKQQQQQQQPRHACSPPERISPMAEDDDITNSPAPWIGNGKTLLSPTENGRNLGISPLPETPKHNKLEGKATPPQWLGDPKKTLLPPSGSPRKKNVSASKAVLVPQADDTPTPAWKQRFGISLESLKDKKEIRSVQNPIQSKLSENGLTESVQLRSVQNPNPSKRSENGKKESAQLWSTRSQSTSAPTSPWSSTKLKLTPKNHLGKRKTDKLPDFMKNSRLFDWQTPKPTTNTKSCVPKRKPNETDQQPDCSSTKKEAFLAATTEMKRRLAVTNGQELYEPVGRGFMAFSFEHTQTRSKTNPPLYRSGPVKSLSASLHSRPCIDNMQSARPLAKAAGSDGPRPESMKLSLRSQSLRSKRSIDLSIHSRDSNDPLQVWPNVVSTTARLMIHCKWPNLCRTECRILVRVQDPHRWACIYLVGAVVVMFSQV
jgi:hypothetical protein